MTVSNINGKLFTALTSLNGRTLSTLSAVNGQTIVASTPVPSTLANIWAWWEPSRETLNDNDPISTLTDQLGGGRNMTATTTERPLYKVNIFNGKAAALLDGDNDSFVVPNASALTAAHLFQVVKLSADPPVNSAESGFHTWSTDNANNAHYPFTDGTIYDSLFSSARKVVGNPSTSMTLAHVYDAYSAASSWIGKYNGTTLLTTGTNTVGIPASARWGINFNTDNLHGYLAGAYLFSAQVTGTDRTSLINYINDRFGTSST